MNNQCFDCGKINPDFISANNGVFICKQCMGIHYQFTDEVSLIIKNNLFLLNEEQINYIYFGGNRRLLEFINYEYPQLQNLQPEILYKTQAMQYYRDNLYYLVEGGEEPLKPNDNFAYKSIENIINYPLTETREKNYVINEENNNSNYGSNILEEEMGDNMYYLDEENNNININMMNNSSNNIENKISDINDINIPLYKKNNSFELGNNSNQIGDCDNNNFLSNNNSKNNFYHKKDKFFNEMNRLFGGFNPDINNENNKSKNSNFIFNKKISTNTYKVKRPKVNFNYNNYIKNTININNNNTNIFFEEDDMNKNIFSKSEMISLDNNPNNKKQINKTTNINNKDNDLLFNNTQIIEPIQKKGKINISKKVFIKPKLKAKNSNKNKNKNMTKLVKDNLYKNINMQLNIEDDT